MITIANNEWIADIEAMTCQNYTNKLLVDLEKRGKGFIGIIKDIPLTLLKEWSDRQDALRLMQKAVLEAEEAFMRAYYDGDQ